MDNSAIKQAVWDKIVSWCEETGEICIPTSNLIDLQLPLECGTKDIAEALQELAKEGKVEPMQEGLFTKKLV